MTSTQRFLLTIIIVLVFLFAIAAIGYFSGGWEDDPEPLTVRFGLASAESRSELCMDDDTRERVRTIMLNALDEALSQKIKDLYAVWLRDPTDQPQRAARGAETAIRAYYHARGVAMKFNPPECSG